MQYVQVRVNVKTESGNKAITVWAIKLKTGYLRVTREGEKTNNYILADKRDIIWEKSARMNNLYGELEIEK